MQGQGWRQPGARGWEEIDDNDCERVREGGWGGGREEGREDKAVDEQRGTTTSSL